MESVMRLVRRSSVSRASFTPFTAQVVSSTPMSNVPPAVFAKATSVRRTPFGEDRSRFSSSVFGACEETGEVHLLGSPLGSL